MSKYTWLFGENLGTTMNNNSWYYFEHIVSRCGADITPYFIAAKTKDNLQKVSRLEASIKRRIIWRNSPKHHSLYWQADMFYVTLSYRDIVPDRYKKHYNLQPLIYLQHGVTAMKKLEYKGDSYANSIFRFLTCSLVERKLLTEWNNFSDYQIQYTPAFPRYKELVKRWIDGERNTKKHQILWFLTWREYLGGAVSQSQLLEKITEIIDDVDIQEYLRQQKSTIKIVLHHLFDADMVRLAIDMSVNDLFTVCYAGDVDVMAEIVNSDLLITDYSSLGFDFTFLNKPVILYQFDFLIYKTKREFYCDFEADFDEYRVTTKEDLLKVLFQKRKKLNTFFESRQPAAIKYEEVAAGKYIDELNLYFENAQRNKYSLVGYNFYGRGGTVSATKSLAEGLAEDGNIVELVSLKRIKSNNVFPNGVITRSFLNPWRSPTESAKYRLFKGRKMMSYLAMDINRDLLIPYVGYALRRYLKITKARTVISTRESLHLFLQDANNPAIKNKLFFFHTTPTLVDKIYPKVMDAIRKRRIKKAVFVSDTSRVGYKKLINYDNYDKYAVTGNSLLGGEVISANEIESVGLKDVYEGIVLTRISKDRHQDLDNIIEFARHLKANSISNIRINVFGMGDALFDFCDKITSYGLTDIVQYRGLTEEPYIEIRDHDFLVDFSENHSFGMVYLEGIMNGVQCFAKSNTGSQEVLKDVPDAIYSDWSSLSALIANIPNVPREQLVKNYNLINRRYSRERVVKKVKELID